MSAAGAAFGNLLRHASLEIPPSDVAASFDQFLFLIITKTVRASPTSSTCAMMPSLPCPTGRGRRIAKRTAQPHPLHRAARCAPGPMALGDSPPLSFPVRRKLS